MASHISHRSRRSSRSFVRFTWKRAIGSAALARMPIIATVIISSTSVSPASDLRFRRQGAGHEDSPLATANREHRTVDLMPTSLYVDYGLPTGSRQAHLNAVLGTNLHQREIRIPDPDRLEGKDADLALAVDAGNPRRPGRRNGHQSLAVVAVRKRHRLAIARQQTARVDIHQLQHLGIELELQRYGEDVLKEIALDRKS